MRGIAKLRIVAVDKFYVKMVHVIIVLNLKNHRRMANTAHPINVRKEKDFSTTAHVDLAKIIPKYKMMAKPVHLTHVIKDNITTKMELAKIASSTI